MNTEKAAKAAKAKKAKKSKLVLINFKVTREERDQIRYAASHTGKTGVSVSKYIRLKALPKKAAKIA